MVNNNPVCLSISSFSFFECDMQVSIQWQSSRKPSVYDHARCTLSAVPPPASPVLDVTLSDLEFSTGITNEVHQFLVQWSPLTSPIGRVTHYLACLEGARLSDVEDHPHDEFSDDWSNTICQQVDIVRLLLLKILTNIYSISF